MTTKTFEDCEVCPVYGICSAHFADGEWEHDEGVDPCVVKIDECKCPPGCTSDCAGCRYNWEENDKELGFV
jgi:hypothetical protein